MNEVVQAIVWFVEAQRKFVTLSNQSKYNLNQMLYSIVSSLFVSDHETT